MTSALPDFVSPLSHIISTLNQNVVKLETSQSFSFLERQSLAMLHRLIYEKSDAFYDEHIHKPKSTLGMLVSGGTLANISALWCARNHALGAGSALKSVSQVGLSTALYEHGYKKAILVGSPLMHYSLRKAADLLGLGEDGLVKCPVDSQQKMDVQELRRILDDAEKNQILIVAIVAIAGATETGTVDPLNDIAKCASEYGIHMHVDAAWGGPLLFSKAHKGLLGGIEKADSVTFDGHKQLYLPMGIGMTLYKDPNKASTIEKNSRYIIRKGSLDLGRRSLEGSRPSMALYLHAGLHIFGAAGYENLIDESIKRTTLFAKLIEIDPDFEVVTNPQMNILTYRFNDQMDQVLTKSSNERLNDINQHIHQHQWQAGKSLISRTTLYFKIQGELKPHTVLRSILANPNTTETDLKAILKEQKQIALDVISSST